MTNVAIIRKTSVADSPRLIKEALSLAKNYSVLILAWDRKGTDRIRASEILRYVQIKHLKLRAPYGNLLLFLYFPFFWIWSFANLLIFKPKVVHACDLDAVIPSYAYKLVAPRAKIVFDVWDNYALYGEFQTRSILRHLVASLEDFFALKANAFILPTRTRLKVFNRARLRPITIIMNCPNDIGLHTPKNSNKFRMVYAGKIRDGGGLLRIANAIKNFSDIELILAGRVDDVNLLKKLVSYSQIRYIGKVSYFEALKLESTANVIPVLYDPMMPSSRTADPNKLHEAMMLGLPVITNLTKNIISETKCGIIVDYNSVNNIKAAILYLKENTEIRKTMGLKGRKAYERKYNWNLMEEKLLQLYDSIVA